MTDPGNHPNPNLWRAHVSEQNRSFTVSALVASCRESFGSVFVKGEAGNGTRSAPNLPTTICVCFKFVGLSHNAARVLLWPVGNVVNPNPGNLKVGKTKEAVLQSGFSMAGACFCF